MPDDTIEINGKVYRIFCGIPAPSSEYRLFQNVIDERQFKELEFAELYEDNFHHGTTGHNQLMLLAILFRLVKTIPVLLAEVK